MTTKTKNYGQLVRRAIAAFEIGQTKYARFGACDTEPDGVFQRHLSQAVAGHLYQGKPDSHHWQLYTDMPGCTAAARHLNSRAKAVCNAVLDARAELPYREWAALATSITDYCWRI